MALLPDANPVGSLLIAPSPDDDSVILLGMIRQGAPPPTDWGDYGVPNTTMSVDIVAAFSSPTQAYHYAMAEFLDRKIYPGRLFPRQEEDSDHGGGE